MADFDDWLRPRLRTLQIISGAIIAGVVAMIGIFMVLRGFQGAPAAAPMVSLIAVGFFLVVVTVASLLPGFLIDTTLRRLAGATATSGQNPRDALFGGLQGSHIVRLALVEGGVMFAMIAYLIEGYLWILAVPAVGLLLLLAFFPTQASVLDRLDRMGRRLEELRLAPPASNGPAD